MNRDKQYIFICVTAFVIWFAQNIPAQENGRFATLKSQAFELVERGQYAEVAGKLEQVWEQNQSDPKVAEYLAMGYLYGEHNIEKARPIAEKAIALGGQASFLVQHSHEHLSVLNGDTINQFCQGRVSISPGKFVFVSDSGEHSTSFNAADLKAFNVLGGNPGRIQIKAAGKTYVLRVWSHTRAEAIFLEQIAEQNLKH